MAGALSGGDGLAQLPAGAFAGRDKVGTAPQLFHDPGRATLAGFEVARKMHTAHHALPREFDGARQQRVAALRDHVREQIAHQVAIDCVPAGVGQVGLHIADAGPDRGFDFART